MKFGFIEDNYLYSVEDPTIYKLAGCDKQGRMKGCGFDKRYAAQYQLWHSLGGKIPSSHTLPHFIAF